MSKFYINLLGGNKPMAVWSIRAGRYGELEDIALKQNVAILSFEEIPDLSSIKTHEELELLCRKTYQDQKPNTVKNWVSQLWIFRERMQIGDLVTLRSKKSSNRATVAIGKIVDAYCYRPDLPANARHTRPLNWLKEDVPLSAFDQDILNSMGSLLAVSQIQRVQAEERILAILNS